jgi:alpha-galactosidase
MPQLKIAVLGAGSFVFGPSVIKDAILEHRLDDLELALVDPARDVVEPLAAVGRRIADVTGVRATVTAHAQRETALPGSDFVICAAAREIKRRFAMDCDIARRHDPTHVITEFGGIAGISYSLRQIALIEEICADIRRHCPSAWLLDVANPLPRVCQAAHALGVKTAGFCSVSFAGYGIISQLLDGQPSRYPFEAPRAKYDATMAGVNHLTWVVELRDRTTRQDMLPALRDRAAAGETAWNPLCAELLVKTGHLITSGDGHCQDFLPPAPGARSRKDSSHGSVDDRAKRIDLLRAIATGEASWEPLTSRVSWEKPVAFVAAMAGRSEPWDVHALNLANEGQVPNLPRGVFVETPARVTSGAVVPREVALPASVEPYCRGAADVTNAIVRAARKRSRTLLREAVERDPTITDMATGIAALDECLAAHADVLPKYA